MSRHGSRTVTTRWLPLTAIAAFVTALCLSVLVTLTIGSRAAQPCPPGSELDPNTGQCVQQTTPAVDIGDPPVQVTIPPDIDTQVTPTSPPTQQISVTIPPPVQVTLPPDIEVLPTVTPAPDRPPEPQLEAIELTKWECPRGVDRESDWVTLTTSCTTPTSTTFTMSHIWFVPERMTESTTTTGYIVWPAPSGLPEPPNHAISEAIPPGYGEPVPWCGLYTPGETEPTLTRRTRSKSGMFTVEMPTATGQHFYCDWFNMQLGNEIVINKLVCPPGTDLGEGLDAWLAVCSDDTTGGYDFTLTTDDGSFTATTAVGTGDAATDGSVSWTGLDAGSFAVEESLPAGTAEPRVWCGAFPLDVLPHPESITLAPVELADGRWSGELETGPTRHVCYWLNIQSGMSLALESANIVELSVHTCPADVDRDLSTRDLAAACDAAVLADTHLSYADLRLAQTTGVDGSARWDGVPPGPYTLSIDLPAGTKAFRTGCGYHTWPDEARVDGRPPTADIAVNFNFPDGPVETTGAFDGVGFTLNCQAFFTVIDEPPPSTVTLKKSDCATVPSGFRTLEEWLAACPAIGEGGFTLTDTSGARHLTTDADGNAMWPDVAAGPVTITEDLEPGFGEPVVWCQAVPGGEDAGFTISLPMIMPIAGGTIEGTILSPGTRVSCFWFNIPDPTPDEGSTVAVRKRICPPDIPATETDFSRLFLECTEPGDGIEFTLETAAGASTRSVTRGLVTWTEVPTGDFTITEGGLPADAAAPIWSCGRWYVNDAGEHITLPSWDALSHGGAPGVITGAIDVEATTVLCYVYDLTVPTDRMVMAFKWICPEGSDLLGGDPVACRAAGDGIEFTLEDDRGSETRTTTGGRITWNDVEPGSLTLTETVPPGHADPVVRCEFDAILPEGGLFSDPSELVSAPGGTVSRDADYPAFAWMCHFFDVSEGEAEITIRKWTCPPGYDVEDPGADPPGDCTEATDGVVFTAGEGGPSAATGDTAPGTVRFGGLDPGAYVIAETVPDGTSAVFVWDCVGGDIPAVHPHPLHLGPLLTLVVAAGDTITCDWYNVPIPEDGSLTVEKHVCRTETFVSEVDCEIFEHGAEFELLQVVEGGAFTPGTTGPTGRHTWSGLPAGRYRLEETGTEPCHVASDRLDAEELLTVSEGEETLVRVYNCLPGLPGDPDTPLDEPGEPPTEWPNTGALPGLYPGLVPQGWQAGTDAATPMAGSGEPFFPVRCVEDAPASPAVDDPCQRGAIPTAITIDAARVDTTVEVVEIIDGVMQAPSGPNVVAWYKESGRLGEPTNMVMAGHLNWWNQPRGVFFHLAELEEGDRIEVTGEDGAVHVFEVAWVRQLSASDPPSLETIGPTDSPSLTLITCGGPWDSANAEYTERTVVRAEQVDVAASDTEA